MRLGVAAGHFAVLAPLTWLLGCGRTPVTQEGQLDPPACRLVTPATRLPLVGGLVTSAVWDGEAFGMVHARTPDDPWLFGSSSKVGEG